MTTRRIARVLVDVGMEGTAERALTLAGFAARGVTPASDGAEQRRLQRGDTDQPGPGVRADDGPDLGDQLGVAPVDLAARLRDAPCHVGRLDMLDEEVGPPRPAT